MAKKPDFNHSSWDTTVWSLWGLLYTGAESDTALKTAISQTFGETRAALARLGPQVGALALKVQEWRDEVASYARTISYGEANSVLLRLRDLLTEIRQQAESDRLLVEAGKKLAPKAEEEKPKPKPRKPSTDEGVSDADLAAWVESNQNTVMGHSKATAKSAPKIVKPKQAYVPPTPEQQWRDQQREMANQCDSGIEFGTHEVNQASVINRLYLDGGDSIVKQYRSGPENGHLRIMKSRNGAYYWTLGLTHREKRDKGEFSVYRRVGAKSQFDHVSGQRHPRDPGP